MQRPTGSNPAFLTSMNSSTEKSDVKTPEWCPSSLSPLRRASACGAIVAGSCVIRSLRFPR